MPHSRAVDGLDLRARLSSARLKVRKTARREPASKRFQGGCAMRRLIVVLILGLGVLAASLLPRYSGRFAAVSQPTAVFDADGKLKLPEGYRHWPFVGANNAAISSRQVH